MSSSVVFGRLITFIREQYRSNEFIPLHAPVFAGHEREYVSETIDSTFVSSVGAYVDSRLGQRTNLVDRIRAQGCSRF